MKITRLPATRLRRHPSKTASSNSRSSSTNDKPVLFLKPDWNARTENRRFCYRGASISEVLSAPKITLTKHQKTFEGCLHLACEIIEVCLRGASVSLRNSGSQQITKKRKSKNAASLFSAACYTCQTLRGAHVGNSIQVPPTEDPDENIDVFENRFEIHFGKSSILL